MTVSPMLPASVVALGIGPAVAGMVRGRPRLVSGVDAVVLVTIGAVVLLDVMPTALIERDFVAVLCLVAGILLPSLAERLVGAGMRRAHAFGYLLALLGIATHSALDGSALAQLSGSKLNLLGIGIMLHQVPVSMMVWTMLRDYPRKWTWGVLAFMGLATLAGYAVQQAVVHSLPTQAGDWFAALIGGSLLHVLAHKAAAPRARLHNSDAAAVQSPVR